MTGVEGVPGQQRAEHTIHILSNPLGTLPKLLYTNGLLLPPKVRDALAPHGARKADVKLLLDRALERQDEARFTGVLQKYKQYQDGLAGGLERLRGKEVIFLDLENLVLETADGRFTKQAVDDFSSKTEPAKHLLSLYSRMPAPVQAAMRDIVFWRIGPYDFPFRIHDGPLRIRNPFADVASTVDAAMAREGKGGLGSHERVAGDDYCRGNGRCSPTFVSIQRFRAFTSKQEYAAMLLQEYNKRHTPVGMGELSRLSETAIRLNRDLLRLKYDALCERLGLAHVDAYMLQGDIGLELLRGVREDTRVIGGKLLHDTKGMPLRGVLEPEAINRLSGWLMARYGRSPGRSAARPVVVKRNTPAEPTARITPSHKYPYVSTLGNPKDTDEGIKGIDAERLSHLERDARLYQFGVLTIEGILLLLNQGNYPVETERGEAAWQDLLGASAVHPLPMRDVTRLLDRPQFPGDDGRLLRPSNCSVRCEFQKYLSIMPNRYWRERGIKENAFAKSGTTLHYISNALPTKQHALLPEFGIRPVPREEYCEVPIVHELVPSALAWDLARGHLERRLVESRGPFYQDLLHRLDAARDTGMVLHDGGSPDAVLVVEGTQEPVIVDFKRRMATFYPVRSFFQQTARYGMAVLQQKKLDARSFYSVIVQTPFSPNKFLEAPILADDGRYRRQRLRIRRTTLDDGLIAETQASMILEQLGNTYFNEDPSRGYLMRALYQDVLPGHHRTTCRQCFANDVDGFQCRVLLEGVQAPWEE